jgi:hypothetical protein
MDESTVDSSMSDSVKLGILIHRMGTLESGMTDIGTKIDNMGTLYPTTIHVDLLLAPIRDKVKDLEDNEKERERERLKQTAQLKLALTVAMVSPIISLFITLVLDRK